MPIFEQLPAVNFGRPQLIRPSRVRGDWVSTVSGGAGWWIVGLCFAFVMILVEQSGISLPLRSIVYSSSDPGRFVAFRARQGQSWMRAQFQFWQEGGRRLAQLENEVISSRVDSAELLRIRTENERLRQELQLRQPQQLQLVEWFGTHSAWFINQGCIQGVRPGAVVYADRSFLGMVEETEAHYSSVRTWNNADWRIPVKIGSASAQGLFQVSRGKPEVIEVLPKAPVQVGDVVVTVGGEGLPLNAPLATVVTISESTDFGTRELLVEPLAIPEKIQWTYVETEKENVCPTIK